MADEAQAPDQVEEASVDDVLAEIKAILEEDFDLEEIDEGEEALEPAQAEAQAEAQPQEKGSAEAAQGPTKPEAKLDEAALNELFERFYLQRKAAEERQKEEAQRLEEVNRLVEQGDYEELGKRVAEQYKARQVYQSVAQKVLSDYLLGLYRGVLADPAMQGLPEEVLDPARYQSDADWLKAVANALAQKQLQETLEKEVAKRLQEKTKADAYAQAGDKLRSPTPTGAPGASGPARAWNNGFERLMVGLQEAFERANRRE